MFIRLEDRKIDIFMTRQFYQATLFFDGCVPCRVVVGKKLVLKMNCLTEYVKVGPHF